MKIKEDYLLKFRNWRKIAFILAMIGVTQYILLCSIAMMFYPGGTELNPTISGYSFFLNQMSDLGRIQSLSGKSNIFSMILFMIAVVSVNLLFIPFYFAMTYFFSEKRSERLFCYLASSSETVSALFGIGIAFLPADLYPTSHLTVTILFSIFFVIALCLVAVPIIANDSYPNRFGYGILLYAIILALYTVIVSVGLNISTEQGFLILATGQKIIIYSGFLCIFILAFGALKRYNKLNRKSTSIITV
ncbi:MAG: hypothetical protein ACFFB5_12815 [Promethearchaeota archaeon]